jgi:predicted transcriptional regulator
LERLVVQTLAVADAGLTPRQVLSLIDRPLAYTTVMTTLVRLHAKGEVSRERVGRSYAYRLDDPATVTARQMRRLLDRDSDRSRVLASFVSDLAPEDERILEALLADARDNSS